MANSNLTADAPDEPARILVVDDEPSIIGAYRHILAGRPACESTDRALERELFGEPDVAAAASAFDLTVCCQGEQAVAAVAEACRTGRPFAVVFLDQRMPPGIDGIATAARIRTIDPALDIVLVTGHAALGASEVALRLPPTERTFYVPKPFQPTEIYQLAAALAAKSRAVRRLERALHSAEAERAAVAQTALCLSLARDQAELANRAKSEFLASMSHELRTPLNVILGFTEIMCDERFGPVGNPRYLGYLGDVVTSANHLLGLINDVLDFSKIDAGKMELSSGEFDLDDLIRETIALMRGQADDAGVDLRFDCAITGLPLRADERRVKQILLNLLSNAVKFTERGGRIVAAAGRSADGGLWCSVADTGVGIAEADIPVALTPFGQVDNILTRARSGTGLGLPLAKRLAEAHGGALTLESTVGRGTTVTIHFPASCTVQERSAA